MTSPEHLDPAEPEVAPISELLSHWPVSVSFLPLATNRVLINVYSGKWGGLEWRR